MRLYEGTRNARGHVESVTVAEVEISVEDRAERLPLKHHVKHSPDGFEWGYGGSGPSELARCILIDHFGDQAKCGVCNGSGTIAYGDGSTGACWSCDGGIALPVSYQDFKWAVIADLPEQKWSLTTEEIEAALAKISEANREEKRLRRLTGAP